MIVGFWVGMGSASRDRFVTWACGQEFPTIDEDGEGICRSVNIRMHSRALPPGNAPCRSELPPAIQPLLHPDACDSDLMCLTDQLLGLRRPDDLRRRPPTGSGDRKATVAFSPSTVSVCGFTG